CTLPADSRRRLATGPTCRGSGGRRGGLVVGHGGGFWFRGRLAAAQQELPALRDGDDGERGPDADQPLVARQLLGVEDALEEPELGPAHDRRRPPQRQRPE